MHRVDHSNDWKLHVDITLVHSLFSAQVVADWLGIVPIYDALLENNIRKTESRELALSNGIYS